MDDAESRHCYGAIRLVVAGDLGSRATGRDGPMHTTVLQTESVRQGHRGAGRRLVATVLLVILAAALAAGVWTIRSRPSGHRVIYSEKLSDGRVFQCFSDGAFIGSPGSDVEVIRAPQAADGSEAGPVYVVRPPNYTAEEARNAAEAYRNSGRTPERDQADFDRLSDECHRRR